LVAKVLCTWIVHVVSNPVTIKINFSAQCKNNLLIDIHITKPSPPTQPLFTCGRQRGNNIPPHRNYSAIACAITYEKLPTDGNKTQRNIKLGRRFCFGTSFCFALWQYECGSGNVIT
jgi:hypothetical protein